VTPVADAIEVRHPHIVTRDRLAIDDAGPRAQPSYELDDQRETMHQIVAGAAVKPRTDAVLTGNDSREDRALGQWRQIGHRDLTQMRRGTMRHFSRPASEQLQCLLEPSTFSNGEVNVRSIHFNVPGYAVLQSRGLTHGYTATRETSIAAFAKSWRRG
jgi:hypothetical protein